MTVMAIRITKKNGMIMPLLQASKKIVKKVKKLDYKSERGIEEFLFMVIMVCFALFCAGCVAFYTLWPLYRMFLC